MRNIILIAIILVLFLYILPQEERQKIPLVNGVIDTVYQEVDELVTRGMNSIEESIKSFLKQQIDDVFDSTQEDINQKIDDI